VLKGRLDAIQAELKTLLDKDVSEFNKAVQAADVPPVAAAPKIGN
jgi:formiminotetrahydrofolate cyclodeaminase